MKNCHSTISRRDFIGLGTAAFLSARFARADAAATDILVGSCMGFDGGGKLRDAGGSYVEEACGHFFVPTEPEEKFAAVLAKSRAAVLPVYSCNGFLPSNLKSVGEKAAHDEIMKYVGVMFPRAKTAGVHVITYGSGASRQIPDGFPREKAIAQMAELCKHLCELAAKHDLTVSIEPLNKGECNFLNRLGEIQEIIAKVDHPALAITADIYHMAREGDGAAELEAVVKHVRHIHIAEKETRSAPGVKGDDFTPWFGVLKKAGYAGRMSLECRWGDQKTEMPRAVETLQKQWHAA